MTDIKNVVADGQQVASGHYADEHTVALLLKDGEALDIGSGVLLSLNNRVFIATAAHNIKKLNSENIYVVANKTPTFKKLKIIRTGTHSVLDVGYLEIDPNELENIDKRLLSYSELELNYNPKDSDWLCLGGFPCEYAKIIHRTSDNILIEGGAFTLWFEPVKISDWSLPEWKVNSHVILEYEEYGRNLQTGVRQKNPKLEGYSGGGVWRSPINPPKGEVWKSSLMKLVSIETGYYKNQIASVKIENILDLIKSDYGFSSFT